MWAEQQISRTGHDVVINSVSEEITWIQELSSFSLSHGAGELPSESDKAFVWLYYAS